MKKFIIQSIILLLAIGVSIYYLYHLRKPYHYRTQKIEKIVQYDTHFDIIIMGTSHAWSFDHNIEGLKGEHFNKAGNSLYYDLQNYLFLKKYLNDSAIIILPLSYFSFGVDENRTDQGMNNSFVNEFYRYLPKSSIYNYSISKHAQVLLNRSKDNFLHELKNIFKKKATENNLKPKKKEISDSLKIARLERHIKKQAKTRYKDHFSLGNYSDSIPNIQYLSTLLEDAIQNGYRPVLVTAPYHEAYNEQFDKQWLNEYFYHHIHSIQHKYRVPYLNYSTGLSINNTAKYYTDSDHLNKNGIDSFNLIFHEDLRELNYIE